MLCYTLNVLEGGYCPNKEDPFLSNKTTLNNSDQNFDVTLMLNKLASGIVLVNQKGIIEYCNETIEEIFGFTVESIIGKPLYNLLLPTMRQPHESLFRSFFAKPFSRSMGDGASFPARHKNGKTIYVSIGLRPLSQHGSDYVLATITPAARLNEASKSLEVSQANLTRRITENKRLKHIAEISGDAVFLLDQEQNVTWLNRAAKSLFDCRMADVSEDHILSLISDKSQDDKLVALRQALGNATVFMGEIEMFHHSGQQVQIDASLQPVFETDVLQGFYFTAKDVTSRRLLEAQMQENNEVLETTARIAKLGFYSLDLVLDQLTWSEEVYNIHELPNNQKIDVKDAINYYAPEAQPIISKAVERTMRTGESFDLELPFITAKNNRIWVRSVGYAEFKDGAPIKLKGAFQDITNMRQAASDAEQAALAKSRFLANMSHELRTPITGVMGLSELLAATPLNPKQSEYVGIINNSADSLLFLVNQVLDYAKLDSGAQKLNESHFNLQSFIFEETHVHKITAQEKSCEFVISIDPKLPRFIYGDKDRIAQVLHNLCSNAIKFTSLGSISVNLRVSDDHFLLCEVTDTGLGINSEDMKKLFTEFQQLDTSFSRVHQGTGLGLTISKQLVELMNGQMDVRSEYGQGSTFSFTLPLFQTNMPEQVLNHVAFPKTLVLVADYIHTKAWNQIARKYGVKIKACAHISDIVVRLKTDDEWRMVILVDISEDLPADTCLASINRVIKPSVELAISAQLAKDGELSKDLLRARNINAVIVDTPPINENLPLEDNISEQFLYLAHWYEHERVTAAPLELTNKAILIVEDNPVNQLLFTEMLSNTGADIKLTNNGQEGIAALEAKPNHYDLVIMDCQMPVMDGFDATIAIRQHLNVDIANIRICAATAHGFEDDIKKCLSVGMDDVLIKPFSYEQLLDILRRNLDKDAH